MKSAQAGFDSLDDLMDGLSSDQLVREFCFEHRDRCVRDVLGHLHHWHLLFLNWYKVGMAGKMPTTPAEGYTWKTTPQLNAKIHEDCQSVTLSQVRRKLNRSHKRLMDLIELHSNDQLFIKQYYEWTRSASLGSYLTSATSAHYAWALKLLKRHAKSIESH